MQARWLTPALMLLAPTSLPAGDGKKDAKPVADKPLHVFRGTLAAKDPPDAVMKKSPHKVHEVKLEGGKSYIIDLVSKDFDPFLRIEDAKGKHLAEDDDGGGGTDARLLLAPKQGGLHRLIVTAYPTGQPSGAYTLTVRAATERDQLDAKTRALHAEGVRHRLKGEHAAAARLLGEAVALWRELYPKAQHPHGHPDLANSLNSLAVVLHAQGKLDEARDHYEQALAIRRKALPADHPDLANSLSNLGAVLHDQGKLDEARVLIEQALAMRRKALPPTHPHLARSLNQLGAVLGEQGKLDEARTHYEQALAIRKKALPPDHPDLANSLNNLGAVLHDQGKLDEARVLIEQALAMQRKALPPDHPHLARSLNNLASVLQEQGKLDEARALHEQALAIRKKALPPNHPSLATSLGNLGGVLHEQGKLDEARAHHEQALALRKKALPPDHPDLATSLNNLGVVLKGQGKLDEARGHFERALAIFKKALPAGHPDLARSLSNLGVVLQELGRLDDAWPALLAAAEAMTGHAARMAAGSAQADHVPLLGESRTHLMTLLSAAAAAPQLTERQRLDLFTRALDGRAVSAAALLRRRKGLLDGADAEARALADQLLAQRRRLADLLLQGHGRRPPADHRRDCSQLQEGIDGLERDLGRRLKPFADAARAERASPADVAGRLPPASALVELLRYRPFPFGARGGEARWGAERYAALVLSRDAKQGARVGVVWLGEAQPIDRAVAAWRADVQAGRAAAGSGRALRRLVWAPLAGALPEGARELIVAPDGALALLPLEALTLDDGKYLIERYAVHYVTGGRDLLFRPESAGKLTGALVLADPDYGAEGGAKGAAQPRSGKEIGLFRSLPGFAKEADAVERLLGGHKGWQVEALRRGRAAEEALVKAGRPRLLYAITHGFFLEDVQREPPKDLLRDLEVVGARPRLPSFGEDPRLRSGLALAGANKWQERSAKGLSDGLLTALEVEDLDLWGTDLVVLSACDTGRGEVQVGEGVLSLRRAFQLAGAQTVLASLWKVPDAETEELMTDTLSRWLKGAPPHQALREAQLEMIRRLRASGARNGKEEAPPLYWAGFICHGR